jgi:hypothetical protein
MSTASGGTGCLEAFHRAPNFHIVAVVNGGYAGGGQLVHPAVFRATWRTCHLSCKDGV